MRAYATRRLRDSIIDRDEDDDASRDFEIKNATRQRLAPYTEPSGFPAGVKDTRDRQDQIPAFQVNKRSIVNLAKFFFTQDTNKYQFDWEKLIEY